MKGSSRTIPPLDASEALSSLERFQVRFIRSTFDFDALSSAVAFSQRQLGSRWIMAVTANLRTVYGLDRLPVFDPNESYICVANHRSFFDMYTVTSYLVREGLLPHRLVFPVRSKFFYDTVPGFFVNGAMSFFAMYPPIFRERKRLHLNLSSLQEVERLLKKRGVFVGIHPEGTRGQGEDPYTLLPAQAGVGKVIHGARVKVIPVFINGLINDFTGQIRSNFDRSGAPVNIVFGKPIDFGDLLDKPSSSKVHKEIAELALGEVARLGEEEKVIRSGL